MTRPPASPIPVQLEKTDDRRLRIQWSDALSQTMSIRTLRNQCPCAACGKKRMDTSGDASDSDTSPNQLPILSIAETLPLDIVHMNPVGNYAYNIHFSDGHTTGIFPFEFLRTLSSDNC